MELNTPKAVFSTVQAAVRSKHLTLDTLNNLHIPLYSSSRAWMEGFFGAGGIDVLNSAMHCVLDGDMCVSACSHVLFSLSHGCLPLPAISEHVCACLTAPSSGARFQPPCACFGGAVPGSLTSAPLIHTTLKCYMAAMKEEDWMTAVIDNEGASIAICSAFICPDEACRELVLKMLSVFAFSSPDKGLPRVLHAWEAFNARWNEDVKYGMLVKLLSAPEGDDTPAGAGHKRLSGHGHR